MSANLRQMLREVVERVAPADASAQPAQAPDGEWDSLQRLEIVLAAESVLNIRFDESELANLTTFDRLIEAAGRHLGQ